MASAAIWPWRKAELRRGYPEPVDQLQRQPRRERRQD
jgi:hypothetical protein